MATNAPDPKEIEKRNRKDMKILQKRKEKLTARIAEQDKFVNDIQSSAFSVANCYFVFQGVLLTIVCNGAQNLKPSNRWFLLTLSILAVVVNLFALIQIGIKYIAAKVSKEKFESRLEKVKKEILLLKRGKDKKCIPCDKKDITLEEGIPCDKKDKKSKQLKIKLSERYLTIYVAIYIIIFLGFAAVVLVGCWKFLGKQNE